MIVDGRVIASAIRAELTEEFGKLREKPTLSVFSVKPDFAAQKFIGIKRTFAKVVGVELVEKQFPASTSTEELITAIRDAAHGSAGIIVQLPLPPSIEAQKVLNAIPNERDIDAVSAGTTAVLSPVVGAIAEIVRAYNIDLRGKTAVVVGSGRLVGAPAAIWLEQQDALTQTVTHKTADISSYTKKADILVLGAGVPGFIKPNMLKDGAVVLDAGTSEEGGELHGDADPACAEVASLFTPVPGGIGPITVAMIFKNLLTFLTKRG